MTERLVSTDEALETLFEELTSLQSTSQQLADAGKSMDQTLVASENIAKLSKQVITDSETQLNATKDLSANTTERLSQAIAAQESYSASMQQFLESELQPQINATKDLAGEASEKLDKAIAAQESFSNSMQEYVEHELQPLIAKYQRSVSIIQWLLIATLLLVLANFGFFIWSTWFN